MRPIHPLLLPLLSVFLCCGTPSQPPPMPVATTIQQALDDDQRSHIASVLGLSPSQAAQLIQVGGEGVFETFAQPGMDTTYDVFVTPGLPTVTSPVLAVLRIRGVSLTPYQGAAALLRLTTDGWATSHDLPGTVLPPERGPNGALEILTRFQLGALSSPQAQWAIEIAGIWANNGGQNYALSTHPAASLSYLGATTAVVGGVTLAPTGASFPFGHDVVISTQTYPPSTSDMLTLLYSTDGLKSIQQVPMILDGATGGPNGDNGVYRATLPAAALATGTAVAYWVQGSDGTHTLYDSNGGANYGFTIGPIATIGWLDIGQYVFNKCHITGNGDCQEGWFWNVGLPDPLDLTPANFQAYAAAPSPGIEIYVAGLTDRYPDGSAAALIQVEVDSPFFSGMLDGAWTPHALALREVSGHNYRYAWDVRNFEIAGMPALGVDNPPDGSYPYKLRVSTDGGATFTWLGTDPWPGDGDNRTATWVQGP